MKRVIWLVMDSFGIGNAKDANEFGDLNADTFGNIAKHHLMQLPNLTSLGLVKSYELNNHTKRIKLNNSNNVIKGSFWGAACERSSGKDTLSGHWEMAGILSAVQMKYYENKIPVFEEELIEKIKQRSGISGILGNRHAGGIEIIEALASEHIKTKQPIFYTSADSVIQIAVHEEVFGLQNLYDLCEIVADITHKQGIGRIIARPFVGDEKQGFTRSKNRKDYALKPSSDTVLDNALKQKKEVIAIGKISDIFAGCGISKKCLAYGLDGLMNETLKQMNSLKNDGIIYTNFVDFDMEWGHRRDVKGYAKGLEYFDLRLKEVIENLQEQDLLIITADHGCDPTYEGSNHTRENVPIFGMLKNSDINSIGIRTTFADMASSIEDFLDLKKLSFGKSFLK